MFFTRRFICFCKLVLITFENFDFTSSTDLTIVFFVIFVSLDDIKVFKLSANRLTTSMRLFVILSVKDLNVLGFNLGLRSFNNF